MAEAKQLLSFSKIRDYEIPDWFSGFFGVPGSILRVPQKDLSPFEQERALLVRLRFLTKTYFSQVFPPVLAVEAEGVCDVSGPPGRKLSVERNGAPVDVIVGAIGSIHDGPHDTMVSWLKLSNY